MPPQAGESWVLRGGCCQVMQKGRAAGHKGSPARAKRVWTVPVSAWELAPSARRRCAASGPEGAAVAASVSASARARRSAIMVASMPARRANEVS